jgi:hypothetical protein
MRLEFSVTMPLMTRDEVTIVTATLRGVDAATKGHERNCRVKVTMRYETADQSPAPVHSNRVGAEIVDSDHFPDGDYEVEFADGSKENFKRKGGRYGEGCKPKRKGPPLLEGDGAVLSLRTARRALPTVNA